MKNYTAIAKKIISLTEKDQKMRKKWAESGFDPSNYGSRLDIKNIDKRRSEMDTKKFQRNKENFTCENCGFFVVGDGYTNHCSKCLWSKHVDINPGDRAESCLGIMKPVRISTKESEYVITHKCTKCEFEKNNKVSRNDDFDKVLKIAKDKASE